MSEQRLSVSAVSARGAVARDDHRVPGPAPGHGRHARSSRSARAARRCCPRPALSARTGCDVYLKVEGVNPTGSFKDRGMTMAITKAAAQGAQGRHLRLDRQHLRLGGRLRGAGRNDLRRADAGGQDRHGQTGPGDGARRASSCRSRATSTTALRWCASSRRPPGRAGQLGQPGPAAGPEDRGIRDRGRARRRPGFPRCRSATPATSPPTGWATGIPRRLASPPARPRMFGFQAAGAAPIVDGAPVRTRRRSRPRSGSATRPPGTGAAARDESGGLIEKVTDRRDPGRLPAASPRDEGVFVEPARRPAWPGCSAGRGRAHPAGRAWSARHRKRPQGPGLGPLRRAGPREIPVDAASAAAALAGLTHVGRSGRGGLAGLERSVRPCPRRARTSGRASTRSGSPELRDEVRRASTGSGLDSRSPARARPTSRRGESTYRERDAGRLRRAGPAAPRGLSCAA